MQQQLQQHWSGVGGAVRADCSQPMACADFWICVSDSSCCQDLFSTLPSDCSGTHNEVSFIILNTFSATQYNAVMFTPVMGKGFLSYYV